jgi:RNA polymerase sigma-70 factor (ECF subfamily)
MSQGKSLENKDIDARLSAIETRWTVLFNAHRSQGDARLTAQKQLLLRYYGAVYRYLLGIVRDPHAADELTQDFAVRFLRGDFHRANPQRGRFRDFLKTSLRHLAQDYWRKQNKAWLPLPANPSAPADSGVASDQEFLSKWREELLAHAWDSLAAQSQSGQPYWDALRAKTSQPGLRSAQLANQLASQTGRQWTDVAARQLLHRSRNLFADLLVDEVARSLGKATQDKLEQELIDLDLLSYCQAALHRRKSAR